jgi:hypothetical protein
MRRELNSIYVINASSKMENFEETNDETNQNIPNIFQI